MKYTKPFKKINKHDVQIAGGKGASLGEMIQAGIPVPDGFVVLSTAFDEFLEGTDVGVEIDAILDTVDHQKMHTVEHASEKIRGLILEATFPASLAKEITAEFKKLNTLFVAVRSSATAEDSSSAAWAGQLESFLNTEKEDLLQNIQKCWASLFSPRAIFYRFEKGLHKEAVSVAVVVQAMVQSEVSGIAFSVHPVTEDRDQLIIEAGYGLGEAIVSGSVTPDSYVVEKSTQTILDVNISQQDKKLVKGKHGNEWVAVSSPDEGRPGEVASQKLSNKEILELSQIIIRIENHYNFPVDVEWAKVGKKFSITQSRPITTLQFTNQIALEKINPKSYTLSFKAGGLNVYSIDLGSQMFSGMNPLLFLAKGGGYYQFFANNKLKSALEEGLKLFGSKKLFAEYQQQIRGLQKSLQTFHAQKLKSKSRISPEDAQMLFQLILDFSLLYGRMNVEYTDRAFEQKERNAILKKNLSALSKLKDELRAFVNLALFEEKGYLAKVFQLLEKQFSVSISDLQYYTTEEMVALFGGKRVNVKDIKSRKQGFVIASTNGRRTFYSGNEASQMIKEFTQRDNVTSDSIRGQVAHKGPVVRAKVKVIPVDYGNFAAMRKAMQAMSKGNVLVAETTAPELMEACKKASAIITDLGGMLSHAAIVSRELGIPCIVSTKVATQILKDGDLVEVNASTGTIRILGGNKEGLVVDKITSEEWTINWDSPMSLLDASIGIPGYFTTLKEVFGMRYEKIFISVKDGQITCYELDSDRDALSKRVIGQIKNDLQSVAHWCKQLVEVGTYVTKKYYNKTVRISEAGVRDFGYHLQLFGSYLVGLKFAADYLSTQDTALLQEIFAARKRTETVYFQMNTFTSRLVAVLSRHIKISSEDLQLWTWGEVEKYFQEGVQVERAVIDARRDAMGLLFVPGGDALLVDSQGLDTIQQRFTAKHLSRDGIRGTIGYKGIHRGVVKKILKFSSNASIEGEEVLVTTMTDPRFVPLMRRAGAIITDAGGTLCHAAIVSRELKIPCIIGTKIATQVLKDGDIVEVDANKGFITLLDASKIETLGELDFLPENYVYSWGAKGFTFLFQSLFSHALAKYDFADLFTISRNGELKVFWSKDARAAASSYGNKLFKDIAYSKKHCTAIHAAANKLRRYRKVSRTDEMMLGEFRCDTIEFLRLYLTLDPEFTNDALVSRKNNKELIAYLGKEKNKLRAILNNEFFDAKGAFEHILKLIAKQYRLKRTVINEFPIEQLELLLKGEKVRERGRKEYGIVVKQGAVHYEYDPKMVARIWKQFASASSHREVQELTGTSVGRKGMYRGPVRKLDMDYAGLRKDIQRLNKEPGGYIFVADHTTPELTPIMKKSVAIVTNMGGMLSHAAITSRELNLPCIVGTEVATQILKDGDIVEVDADNGIITRVNK